MGVNEVAMSKLEKLTNKILQQLFPGDSELAVLMREFDWASSKVGSPDTWPHQLCTALSICLTSKFPMHIWWGPDLTLFYNDAYISFLGPKHPAALGQSGREVWSELWPVISPMIEQVRTTGIASWSEDILMFFDRTIPKEEVYLTFSFSPIYGEGHEVAGLFCATTETTEKLVSNRRIETLRDLNFRRTAAENVNAACKAAVEVLAINPHDIPFAAIYIFDETRSQLLLSASTWMSDLTLLPLSFNLEEITHSIWRFNTVLNNKRAEVISDLIQLGLTLPGGAWPESANQAITLLIPGVKPEFPAGFLIVGVSPRRILDEKYLSFFEITAGHIGSAIADAQVYEKERKRVNELTVLDQAKTTFFSNISHEFRTPLTLMLAPLEDAMTNLSASHKSTIGPHLETVHRNAMRLLKLVNTLLDFSRIEAGRIQGSFEPIDLATFTHELASTFRSAIERAGLQFIVNCEALPEAVYVDKEMWEKIVLNLLSNAFKFTFEGQIEISLKSQGKQVELTVRDSGIGIEEKELANIFKRFHRIENVNARTHEGSGIGLSLVQELVRLHAGNISVRSEIGKGTTFTVAIFYGIKHLPKKHIKTGSFSSQVANPHHAPAFMHEILQWSESAKGGLVQPVNNIAKIIPGTNEFSSARILVVDDNADMRAYLTRLLSSRWKVKAVNDGEEALAALRKTSFDLILSDVMMPNLDGFGLIERLRADPKLKNIPVIMLSARAGEEALVEGFHAGADDYLIKPFSAKEVIARVSNHLKLSNRRKLLDENVALTKLHEISARLGREEELPTLLQAIIDAAIALSGANRGILQLYNLKNQTLVIAAHKGIEPTFLQHFQEVDVNSGTVCAEVLRLKQRVLIDDVTKHPRYKNPPVSDLLKAANICAVQSTPIKARNGEFLGVISTHWSFPHQPDDSALKILDLLAHEAASLIEYRQREEALRKAKEEAEKNNQAKDLFLATLSHELRTPLTSILTWAQILNAGLVADPAKLKMGLESIEESALTQNQLINDLLDVSGIIMGKLLIDLHPINLKILLQKVVDAIRPTADKKSIGIHTEIDVHNVLVSADSARLKQVLWNLLANAIKFTPPSGKITVKLSTQTIDGNKLAQIIIQDTGKGIKPEFLPHIFNLFSQADSSSVRVHGGMGIGLALVNNLLKLLGGTISAESPGVNQGSTFTVSLPLLTEEPHMPELSGLKILFVDDEEKTREAMSVALSSLGAKVILASSAKAAFEIFISSSPDVIVSDIAMPEEDGYSLLAKIRAHESYMEKPIPTIALTAYNRSTHFGKSSSDFHAYLTKPVDILQLARVIKEQSYEISQQYLLNQN